MKRAVPAATAHPGRNQFSESKVLTVSFFFARQPLVYKFWQSMQPSLRGAVPIRNGRAFQGS
ncbi:MAG TPA: hypothetical protein VFB30_19450 [Spirochaetia bacterium]|nr:hypothetical protein [Spirochaetia bacterium]